MFFFPWIRQKNHTFIDPPVVTVKPENVTVNETADFLLFCEYESNPATLEHVKW